MIKSFIHLLFFICLLMGCSSVRSFHCSDCNNEVLLKESTDKFVARRLPGKFRSYKYKVREFSTFYEVTYDNCDRVRENKNSRKSTCGRLVIEISKRDCKIGFIKMSK